MELLHYVLDFTSELQRGAGIGDVRFGSDSDRQDTARAACMRRHTWALGSTHVFWMAASSRSALIRMGTVRYLGIEVDDARVTAEQTEI